MKIDTSRIDGFDSMSPEEKVNALMGLDIEDYSEENRKLKAQVDTYSSEIAAHKKKEKERMSEDERIKAETEEEMAKLKKDYAELLEKSQLASYVAQYKALGYDDDLANDTAKATLKGNFEKVIANQMKFNEALEKRVKADVLKNTPHPEDNGVGNKAKTKEDLAKMTPQERFKFSQEHKEEYQKIYGGN